MDRFNILRQQASGLLLMPVNCDDMAQHLKINAYFCLATNEGKRNSSITGFMNDVSILCEYKLEFDFNQYMGVVNKSMPPSF